MNALFSRHWKFRRLAPRCSYSLVRIYDRSDPSVTWDANIDSLRGIGPQGLKSLISALRDATREPKPRLTDRLPPGIADAVNSIFRVPNSSDHKTH